MALHTSLDLGQLFLVFRGLILAIILILTYPPVLSADPAEGEAEADRGPQVQLVMTGTNRAIVVVEGKRLVMSAGKKDASGVELLEADSERAILKIGDETITLRTGEVAAPILEDDGSSSSQNIATSDTSKKVTLWADEIGFFYARGEVGGRSARFLVDTGANTVTFSSRQADALDIKYQDGRDGFASTASGIAPIKSIVLNRLTVEGISLRNIAANIVLGDFPETPLLGGSFLNKLNMQRSGKKMELSRY